MCPSSMRTGTLTVSTRSGYLIIARRSLSRARTSAAASKFCSASLYAFSALVVVSIVYPPRHWPAGILRSAASALRNPALNTAGTADARGNPVQDSTPLHCGSGHRRFLLRFGLGPVDRRQPFHVSAKAPAHG